MKQNTITATTDLVGVVLAGGKSSRMGQDKAALRLAGETLLLRARKTLLTAGCTHILLSGNHRPEWPDASVGDRVADTGPVGGIISVLYWVREHLPNTTTLLFVPVDTPLLSTACLRLLVGAIGQSDGCTINNSPLPLALRTTDATLAQCKPMLAALQAGESCAIKRFLQALNLGTLDITDTQQRLLTNINTPSEWEKLHREFENGGHAPRVPTLTCTADQHDNAL